MLFSIAFYCHTSIFFLYYCIYLYSFVIFSPFCTYIFLPPLFTFHFLKIAHWQSKAQCSLRLLTRERLFNFSIMPPGYSSIFKRIRQEAGLEALKLARTMEKTSYKLEAHHRHLCFSHNALEQQWIPKSLRFKPPGSHPIWPGSHLRHNDITERSRKPKITSC